MLFYFTLLFLFFVVVFFVVSDAKKVRVTGRGVQPNGVRVNDVAIFRINSEKAGEGKPEVHIIGPGISRVQTHYLYK